MALPDRPQRGDRRCAERRDVEPLDAESRPPRPGEITERRGRERLRPSRRYRGVARAPARRAGDARACRPHFAQIGSTFGTSPAVARQTLYEARLSLRRLTRDVRWTAQTVIKALSDADGRLTRRRELRAHLRSCANCRRFREDIAGVERDLAVIARCRCPPPAAAGLLRGLIGGGNATGAGGLAGALGAVMGKSVAGSVIAKSAATVAAVAVIGGAADRSGVSIWAARGRRERPAEARPAPERQRPGSRSGASRSRRRRPPSSTPRAQSRKGRKETGNGAGEATGLVGNRLRPRTPSGRADRSKGTRRTPRGSQESALARRQVQAPGKPELAGPAAPSSTTGNANRAQPPSGSAARRRRSPQTRAHKPPRARARRPQSHRSPAARNRAGSPLSNADRATAVLKHRARCRAWQVALPAKPADTRPATPTAARWRGRALQGRKPSVRPARRINAPNPFLRRQNEIHGEDRDCHWSPGAGAIAAAASGVPRLRSQPAGYKPAPPPPPHAKAYGTAVRT